MADKITVLLADDHALVRKGFRRMLEDDRGISIVGEASDGNEAVRLALELCPNVTVMDCALPGVSGIEATRQIRAKNGEATILMLSMHSEDTLVRQALEAGARGYILKDDAGRNLLAAVEAVRRRKPFLSSRVSGAAAKGTTTDDGGAERLARPLTPREREIVQLLAEGKSNKEIATFLKISVKTAETHRANIMLKLNFHSVTELVRYAVKNKIIQA